MNITVRMSVTDGDPNGIGTAEIANRTVQATSMPSMWSIAFEHSDLPYQGGIHPRIPLAGT